MADQPERQAVIGQVYHGPSASHEVEYDAHVQAAANEGNTRPPALDEVVSLHFVTLVVVDGQMWELDGRKSGPVSHGPASRDTILQVPSPPSVANTDPPDPHCCLSSDKVTSAFGNGVAMQQRSKGTVNHST